MTCCERSQQWITALQLLRRADKQSLGKMSFDLRCGENRWLATPKRWRFIRGHDTPRLMGVASHQSFPGVITYLADFLGWESMPTAKVFEGFLLVWHFGLHVFLHPNMPIHTI